MFQSPFLRSLLLRSIEARGSRWGAPTFSFPDKIISIPGDDFHVARGLIGSFVRFLIGTSGFYLALPANVFGVVVFPNGTSHNMAGGVHEAAPGLYRLQYVDGHERSENLSPISEVSTDGEKVTLTVILRYRVIDPVDLLRIDRPVETLIEHIETDVAQYIRTHAHTDITDSSENNHESKLRSFFVQRHSQRFPLSRAFIITGIEIKSFLGDDEYLEIRRKADIDSKRSEIEKEQAKHQQELAVLKAQFHAASEKALAAHTAELAKKAAEHKVDIEKLEARHEREKQEILDQVQVREIELENKRRHLQTRRDQFSQVVEAFSRYSSSTIPMNPMITKSVTDLLNVIKEEIDNESQPSGPAPRSPVKENHDASAASPTGPDKVEVLKNTLLTLLNPRK